LHGDFSAWFYRYLAGIRVDPEKPGFKHITIRPRPVGDLTWVKAYHDCMYGRIESRWRLTGRRFRLDVSIPPNTTATVWLPAEDAASVTEGGKALAGTEGLRTAVREKGWVCVDVPSGRYGFECDGAR